MLTILVHRILALSFGLEERTQPKTDTCHPLPDLWCCSRREMWAGYWTTPHNAASWPPI